MKGKKRISMLLVVILIVFMLWFAMEQSMNSKDTQQSTPQEEVTLEVWYSEPELQQYIEEAAKSFETTNHMKVNTRLMSEVDYIENINNQSVGEEFEGPDVYLVSNDQLEMVELAGLTKKVKDKKSEQEKQNETENIQPYQSAHYLISHTHISGSRNCHV